MNFMIIAHFNFFFILWVFPSLLFSQYNENIVLMLWRAESILVTEDISEHHKILRLVPVILRKLAMVAQKVKSNYMI